MVVGHSVTMQFVPQNKKLEKNLFGRLVKIKTCCKVKVLPEMVIYHGLWLGPAGYGLARQG